MKKIIDSIVEIPRGSTYKYELDEETGQLYIDRPLPSPLPYNYGFVPDTLYEDGDPLDVCIIGDPIVPKALVRVEVVGAFLCDDNGDKDDKIVAKVVGEELPLPLFTHLDVVCDYLETYKEGFKVLNFVGAEDAMKIVQESLVNEQDPRT